MLDPLTALSLASNIIQIVQFTSDIVSRSREYYDSADGALVEQLELEAITANLQTLSKDLDVPDGGNRKTKSEQQLRDLCTGCREISDELLDVIRTLKLKTSPNRWDSFRQALNSIWKEDKIRTLETRLERYRRQIDTALLMSIRESIEDLPKSERETEKVSDFIFMGKEEERVKQWQAALVDEVHRSDWKYHAESNMLHFSSKLAASAEGDRDLLLQQHMLEQLHFHSMEDRAKRIPIAHQKTFDWIFQRSRNPIESDEMALNCPDAKTKVNADQPTAQTPWSNFVDWLESDNGLYWITGKPGAGKSTLMKYLQSDERTLGHLKPWLGDHSLIVAGHFFWNSGISMQMSKTGLLRTILYRAVQHNLDLIPHIFQRRWRSFHVFGGDLHEWTMSELLQAFQALLSEQSRKFFFFIDGLDEFDGDGTELVRFVLDLISSWKHVKLCIASRPWLVFEDAFKSLPSLRVQDLTAPDIRRYIKETLGSSEMFGRWDVLNHSEATRLISEVVERADGVFLWVTLVVMSLLEGLRDGDALDDLHARLLSLPCDLEDLFEKILRGIDPNYIGQASTYFQLLEAAREPPTLILLSYAEEGCDKAISTKLPETRAEQEFRIERMRRRVISRSKGLLEPPPKWLHKSGVEYLHRTVRDYIRQPKVWDFILTKSKTSFNPDVALCAAWLRITKDLSPPPIDMQREAFRFAFKTSAEYSARFSKTIPGKQTALLDELSRVVDELPTDGSKKINPMRYSCFVNYAYRHGLREYVLYMLRNGLSPKIQISSGPLLYEASRQGDVEMVILLFSLGANPNICSMLSCTAWESYLSFLQEASWSGERGKCIDILEIFLDHGADVRVVVNNTTVIHCIQQYSGNCGRTKTDELLRKVAASTQALEKEKVQGQKALQNLPVTQPRTFDNQLAYWVDRDKGNDVGNAKGGSNTAKVLKKTSRSDRKSFRGLKGMFKRLKVRN